MGVVVVVVSATSISLEAVFITFQRRMAALRVEESMMNKVLKVDGLAVLLESNSRTKVIIGFSRQTHV
jgi:hypothetical protein